MIKRGHYNIFYFISMVLKLLVLIVLYCVTPVAAVISNVFLYKCARFTNGAIKYADIPELVGTSIDAYIVSLELPEPWCYIATILLVVILTILLILFMYVGVTLLTYAVTCLLLHTYTVKWIDTKNKIFYALETNLGKPHKDRLSGEGFFEYLEARRSEKKEKKDQKLIKKYMREMPGIFRSPRPGNPAYGEDDTPIRGQGQDPSDLDDRERIKLNKALSFYGFRNLNFTLSQLDTNRKKLIVKYHPDNNPGQDTSEFAMLVTEYYTLLSALKK